MATNTWELPESQTEDRKMPEIGKQWIEIKCCYDIFCIVLERSALKIKILPFDLPDRWGCWQSWAWGQYLCLWGPR